MPKWYFVEYGTRPNERIVARYTPSGNVHSVASAFISRDGYRYKLYPVSYGGYPTIDGVEHLSVHDVDIRGYRGKRQ